MNCSHACILILSTEGKSICILFPEGNKIMLHPLQDFEQAPECAHYVIEIMQCMFYLDEM